MTPVRDVQRANALRSAHLVRGQRAQIDAPARKLERQLAGALRGIDVQRHAARSTALRDRGHVLDHARLVVDVHDRNQRRRSVRAAATRSGSTMPSGSQSTWTISTPLISRARALSSSDLCSMRDVTSCRPARPCRARTPCNARLFASVAPDVKRMPVGCDPHAGRDLRPRVLDEQARAPTGRMHGRRVGVVVAHTVAHCVCDDRIDRRSSRVIEVNLFVLRGRSFIARPARRACADPTRTALLARC